AWGAGMGWRRATRPGQGGVTDPRRGRQADRAHASSTEGGAHGVAGRSQGRRTDRVIAKRRAYEARQRPGVPIKWRKSRMVDTIARPAPIAHPDCFFI